MLVSKLDSFGGEFNTIMSFWRKGVPGMARVMEEGLEVQVTQVRLGVKGIR